MKKVQSRSLNRRFSRQHGVVSRPELRLEGVTAATERARVAAGEWERPTPRVVRLAGAPRTPEQDLMVAVLESGPSAVASHASAAWLWGLLPVPDRHEVTVGRAARARQCGFTVHCLTSPPAEVSFVRNIPCTNPLRTLIDLAGVVPADVFDEALDRALARRLLTVEAVRAEMGRLSRPGRKGVGSARSALARRRLIGAPHPSVLESRFYRLLRLGGLEPLALEVVAGPEGGYRLDVLLDPKVAVEVDGHAYHSTPEQKTHDERRRAEIRLQGVFLLVYDWASVTRDGRRVLAECRQALAQYGSARGAAAGRLVGR